MPGRFHLGGIDADHRRGLLYPQFRSAKSSEMKFAHLFLAAPALALAATPAAARDWGKVSGWYVNSGENSCGMYSQDRGGKGTEIVILKRLDGNIYVQANNLGWNIPRGSEAGAIFRIDGARYNGIMNIAALAAYPGRGLLAVFDSGFEQSLRKGSRLSISAGGRNVTNISLKGSAAALAVMRSCLDDLRAGGGSNAASSDVTAGFATLAAVQAKPIGSVSSWIQAGDYPAGNHGNAGTTRFRLTVGTDGGVEECEITRSSGHANLDKATCRAMKRRARFEAATDANGNKVSGSYENKVTWQGPG